MKLMRLTHLEVDNIAMSVRSHVRKLQICQDHRSNP